MTWEPVTRPTGPFCFFGIPLGSIILMYKYSTLSDFLFFFNVSVLVCFLVFVCIKVPKMYVAGSEGDG